MAKKAVSIHDIRFDGGTQARCEINMQVVEEYKQLIQDEVDLGKPTVFYDGANYWLADGFHRFFAHKKAGADVIYCDIINGTQEDAILFSCGANAEHGLRRTNEDKRKAVAVALGLRPELSDRAIAELARVGAPLVASVRAQVRETAPEKRVGKDGKRYSVGPQVKEITPESGETIFVATNGDVVEHELVEAETEPEWQDFDDEPEPAEPPKQPATKQSGQIPHTEALDLAAAVQELAGRFVAIKRLATELGKKPGGQVVAEIRQDAVRWFEFDQLQKKLFDAIPARACPHCRGVGAKDCCRNRGWQTRGEVAGAKNQALDAKLEAGK